MVGNLSAMSSIEEDSQNTVVSTVVESAPAVWFYGEMDVSKKKMLCK